MGQNIRPIQDVLINLENNCIITPQQAQRFMKDYHNQVQSIQEVSKFVNNPNLTQFLKYYILHKYTDKGNKKMERKGHTPSRKEIQDQINSIVEQEVKSKIQSHYCEIIQTIANSLKKICNIIMQQKIWLMKDIIKEIIRQNMKIEDMRIMRKNKNQLIVYDLSLDFVDIIEPQNAQFGEYSQLFDKMPTNGLEIDKKCITITFVHQECQYVYELRGINQGILGCFSKLKENQSFIKLLEKIGVELYSCFDPVQGIQTTQNKIFSFSLLTLKIVMIGAKIQEESIRQQLIELFNSRDQFGDLLVSSIAAKILTENSLQTEKSSFTLLQISKWEEKIKKQIANVQIYINLIQNKAMFLDFDKYSQLKFGFFDKNNQMSNKIKSCWVQNRTKIIDILGQSQNLLSKMSQISKRQCTPGVSECICQGYVAKISVTSNLIFDRLNIVFDSKYQNGTITCEDITVECVADQKENKKLTSVFQQQLVKKMERQDPDIRKTGWLKLFVKEPLEESKDFKEESKWSMKQLQHTEEINRSSLNVISMNQQELQNLVVTIMKVSPIFSNFVNNEQTYGKFNNFLLQIKSNCSIAKNTYHNFSHAVNVMHMSHLICRSINIQAYLSSSEIFSVLFSCLCHNIGHTGFTNQFEIATFSEKALIYNDISPLQNYSAGKTFQILNKVANNFLQPMERTKFMAFKQNVILNILNTDGKEHFNLLNKFKQWSKLPKDQALKDTGTLTSMIVRTSDFGGSIKQFQISKQWSHRLNSQYLKQYEQQKKLGIDTHLNIFDLKCLQAWAKNEATFLNTTISNFCQQETEIQISLKTLNENILKWQKIKQKSKKN